MVYSKAVMLFCVVNVCTFFNAQTFAWGSAGHAIVCDIAWQNLTVKTRSWIEPLYKEKGFYSFAESCNWADQIRSDSRYDYLGPMHYVNLPKNANEYSKKTIICGEKSCITEAILENIQRLQKEEKNLSQFLLLLSHFVGDIHQPLHVSYAEDWGGNKVKRLVLDKNGNRVESNLHRIWDSWLLQRLGMTNWVQSATTLNDEIKPENKALWQSQKDVHLWAEESYSKVREIYSELDDNKIINTDYATRNREFIRNRLQQAGIRLAEILNTIHLKDRE